MPGIQLGQWYVHNDTDKFVDVMKESELDTDKNFCDKLRES